MRRADPRVGETHESTICGLFSPRAVVASGLPAVSRSAAGFRLLKLKTREKDLFMHKVSLHDALHAGRLFSLLTIGALAVLVALEFPSATAWAQTAEKRANPAIRPEFREPVTLTSKEGVLEVRLTARQGQAMLDTVAIPVQNFLLFD